MKAEDDTIIFQSTGRSLYAHRAIVGLCVFNDVDEPSYNEYMRVFDGYDGNFNLGDIPKHLPKELTQVEREELADFMIAKWQEFRSR